MANSTDQALDKNLPPGRYERLIDDRLSMSNTARTPLNNLYSYGPI